MLVWVQGCFGGFVGTDIACFDAERLALVTALFRFYFIWTRVLGCGEHQIRLGLEAGGWVFLLA